MEDLILLGLQKLSIEITAEQRQQFETYIGEIELFNPLYRLVSYEGRDEFVIRHLLDCASGLPVIRKNLGEGQVIADFGSGAGLPGLVLAILMPDVEVVLVERMKKRCDFLRNAVLRCNLKNARVVSKDVKDVGKKFPLVTFRAFHPLYDIIDVAGSLLEEGGCICAYKAQKSYIEAELDAISGYDAQVVALRVPFLDEVRNMLVLHKSGEKSE